MTVVPSYTDVSTEVDRRLAEFDAAHPGSDFKPIANSNYRWAWLWPSWGNRIYPFRLRVLIWNLAWSGSVDASKYTWWAGRSKS